MEMHYIYTLENTKNPQIDLEQVVLTMAIEIRPQRLHEHLYFGRLGGIQTLTSTETIFSHGLRLVVKPACPCSAASEAACGL